MRRVFEVLPLFLILSICTISQSARRGKEPIGARDEQGIRKVLADFTEAWNKHDAKAFSMVFAEDADFTNVSGVSVHGRTEVEKFHTPRFATKFKDTNLKIIDAKIRFLKPDVAAVDGRWEMTGGANREGQDIPKRIGLLSLLMTKKGNKWSITIMHNMDLRSNL